jgi:site-specific recombinase XerD
MLLEVVREVIRLRHLSYKTEKHYLHWIRRFVVFNGRRHPAQIGEDEIAAFLSHLAIDRDCAPYTLNQALDAIVFLFKNVLGRELGQFRNIQWARRKQRAPEVMTREETSEVLSQLQHSPQKWLVASLMYECGLRLSEALRLRVKDVEFGQGLLVVRDAQGGKDRVVPCCSVTKAAHLSTTGATQRSKDTIRGGPRRWIWSSLPPPRPLEEISERGS